MRVFIVDDHPLMREPVAAAVRAEGGEVVGETGSGQYAISVIPALRPEVVVLDIRLSDMSGFTVVEHLRVSAKSARFLALSAALNDFTHMETERLRLAGFMHKGSADSTSLRSALAAVRNGRTFFCPRYLAFRDQVQADTCASRKLLTPTEIKVLTLVGNGFDDADIAARLGSERSTVVKHRSNLLHKLSLQNSTQLVRYAIEHGFAP